MYCQAGLFVFVSRNLSISVAPDIRNFKKLAFLMNNPAAETAVPKAFGIEGRARLPSVGQGLRGGCKKKLSNVRGRPL